MRLVQEEAAVAGISEVRSLGGDSRICQAILFMEANLHRDLSVGLIAAHVGLAPSTFWNLWRRERDDSPKRALRVIRVERAKKLLREGEAPTKGSLPRLQ
jgi:transcriptional regulator GlxA family with amidase domain